MRSLYKLIKRPGHSEKGFVLIVALIGILILIAVGFLALTMLSGDLMISYRMIGERKALSAAQSGVNSVMARLSNPGADTAISQTAVDSTNDPSSFYSSVSPVDTGLSIVLPGFKSSWTSKIWNVSVTGINSDYNSSMNIMVGIADEGGEGGTAQGKL